MAIVVRRTLLYCHFSTVTSTNRRCYCDKNNL